MLLQTNSYIVPKEKRVEHSRLLRKFRHVLARIGCDHFETYEQVGANWNSADPTGRYVQIMRFRDRRHQQRVQQAEKTDPGAQAVIAEFCNLINLPYQQQQGLFAVGFYTSVLPVATSRARAQAEAFEEEPQDQMVDPFAGGTSAEATAGAFGGLTGDLGIAEAPAEPIEEERPAAPAAKPAPKSAPRVTARKAPPVVASPPAPVAAAEEEAWEAEDGPEAIGLTIPSVPAAATAPVMPPAAPAAYAKASPPAPAAKVHKTPAVAPQTAPAPVTAKVEPKAKSVVKTSPAVVDAPKAPVVVPPVAAVVPPAIAAIPPTPKAVPPAPVVAPPVAAIQPPAVLPPAVEADSFDELLADEFGAPAEATHVESAAVDEIVELTEASAVESAAVHDEEHISFGHDDLTVEPAEQAAAGFETPAALSAEPEAVVDETAAVVAHDEPLELAEWDTVPEAAVIADSAVVAHHEEAPAISHTHEAGPAAIDDAPPAVEQHAVVAHSEEIPAGVEEEPTLIDELAIEESPIVQPEPAAASDDAALSFEPMPEAAPHAQEQQAPVDVLEAPEESLPVEHAALTIEEAPVLVEEAAAVVETPAVVEQPLELIEELPAAVEDAPAVVDEVHAIEDEVEVVEEIVPAAEAPAYDAPATVTEDAISLDEPLTLAPETPAVEVQAVAAYEPLPVEEPTHVELTTTEEVAGQADLISLDDEPELAPAIEPLAHAPVAEDPAAIELVDEVRLEDDAIGLVEPVAEAPARPAPPPMPVPPAMPAPKSMPAVARPAPAMPKPPAMPVPPVAKDDSFADISLAEPDDVLSDLPDATPLEELPIEFSPDPAPAARPVVATRNGEGGMRKRVEVFTDDDIDAGLNDALKALEGFDGPAPKTKRRSTTSTRR